MTALVLIPKRIGCKNLLENEKRKNGPFNSKKVNSAAFGTLRKCFISEE